MKRLFLILLAALMLLSCLALSACKKDPEPEPDPAPNTTPNSHTHEFADNWSTSSSEHWHACTHKGCTEAADKAAHSWNAGIITVQPTEDKQGVKAFTCQICGRVKTAPSDYVGDPDDLDQDFFDPNEDLGEDPFV